MHRSAFWSASASCERNGVPPRGRHGDVEAQSLVRRCTECTLVRLRRRRVRGVQVPSRQTSPA